MSNREKEHVEILFHQPGHLKGVRKIVEIEDYIFTGGEDGRICIWDTNLAEEMGCLYAHNVSINDIQKLSEEEVFVTASNDLELKLWSLKNFSMISSRKAHASTIIGSKPWNEFVISASRDYNLKKWKYQNKELVEESRVKIPEIDKFFLCDEKIITTDQNGLMSILKIEDFSQVDHKTISKKKLIKAIKKAGKYIKDFENKDPHTILFDIARRYGIPSTICGKTNEFFILGHQFGLISIWRRDNGNLFEVHFLHSKHITGVEVQENKLITTSLDSTVAVSEIETGALVKSIELPSRPLALKKSSKGFIIIGLESGDILILNQQLEIIRTLSKITAISSSCVTPDFVAIAFNNGEIQLIDNSNLEIIIKKKIHDKTPLSISYYKNRLITVGEDKLVHFLDEKLNITKSIQLSLNPTQPKKAKQYITINSNHVLDLNKDEIIKGEISKETEKELEDIIFPKYIYQNGDLSIKINKQILNEQTSNKLREFFSEEVLESFRILADANTKAKYSKSTEHTVLRTEI